MVLPFHRSEKQPPLFLSLPPGGDLVWKCPQSDRPNWSALSSPCPGHLVATEHQQTPRKHLLFVQNSEWLGNSWIPVNLLKKLFCHWSCQRRWISFYNPISFGYQKLLWHNWMKSNWKSKLNPSRAPQHSDKYIIVFQERDSLWITSHDSTETSGHLDNTLLHWIMKLIKRHLAPCPCCNICLLGTWLVVSSSHNMKNECYVYV